MTRDWTEEQARAWLRASLPRGWRANAYKWCSESALVLWQASVSHGPSIYGFDATCHGPTLRSACRALIRAAKRAGIAVNDVPEPGGKS